MSDLHPCKGKCSEFKNEQCHTCLIQDIEKREFELGVAPEDAYVKGGQDNVTVIDEAFKSMIDESFIEVFGVSTLP